MTYLKLVEVVR